MPTVVLLGTGTGVGKTYATVTIATALAGQMPCATVLALKPIESGVLLGQTSDADLLAQASKPQVHFGHACALKAPLSPHLAARLEDKVINLERVTRWVRSCQSAISENLRTKYGNDTWTLVETAGGALSPLNVTQTNLAIAQALEPAIWILVAPNRLGVLHDLRATLLALERTARPPDIVLLNAAVAPDQSTATNRHEIEALHIAQITAEIMRNSGMSAQDESRLLAQMLEAAQRKA